MSRPEQSEYVDYYHAYISRVPDGDIVDTLERQRDELTLFLHALPEDRGDFAYAAGKWTLKEVLGHIVDVERVFGYRALAFARRDPAALPSMDQDAYVADGNFSARTIVDLAHEFDTLRRSHVTLFRSFDDEVWMRRGTASGFEFTVRAIAWILAGHSQHHARVIRERYL